MQYLDYFLKAAEMADRNGIQPVQLLLQTALGFSSVGSAM